MRNELAVAFIVLCGFSLAAQQAPVTGTITGRVVDAETGEPVAGAIVEVTPSQARPLQPAFLTGDDGRFVFQGVPAGSCRVQASKSGALAEHGQTRPGGTGAPVTVAAGQRLDDVTIRWWRPAVVSGRVVDERGRPMPGLDVRAVRYSVFAGAPISGRVHSAATDDRGEYRISGLKPGQYVMVVPVTHATVDDDAARIVSTFTDSDGLFTIRYSDGLTTQFVSGSTGLTQALSRVPVALVDATGRYAMTVTPGLVPPAPDRDGRAFTYVTTFAPGVTSVASAQIVTVTAGHESGGVDLEMRLAPAVRVEGRIAGDGVPGSTVTLQLMPEDAAWPLPDLTGPIATTRTDRFVFANVPAGAYRLEALRRLTDVERAYPDETRGFLARQTLSVGDTTISNLSLVLRPAASVTARIEFDGPAPRGLKGALMLQGSALGPITAVPAELPAAFRLVGIRPGRYFVRVHVEGTGNWTLQSATLGSRNVADEPLEVGADDVRDIVVTLTNTQTRVTGVVSGAEHQSRRAVGVFPTDRRGWLDTGQWPRRVLLVRTDETGRYTIDGLPPGDYYVNAVDETLVDDWPAHFVLQALVPGAALLQLGPGETRTVDVRRRP